jgi:hypothetical protein
VLEHTAFVLAQEVRNPDAPHSDCISAAAQCAKTQLKT